MIQYVKNISAIDELCLFFYLSDLYSLHLFQRHDMLIEGIYVIDHNEKGSGCTFGNHLKKRRSEVDVF